MNRSNFRLLPTPEASHTAASTASIAAESELVALFGGLVALGERDEESPDYELLEAAVDGKLDVVETEIFASRLAGDPVLAREFAELVALRDRLNVPVIPVVPVAPVVPIRAETLQPASRSWVGFAAAAVLLVAAGLGLRLDRPDHRPAQSTTASASSADVAPAARQVVFADSFEGGTTEHWSN